MDRPLRRRRAVPLFLGAALAACSLPLAGPPDASGGGEADDPGCPETRGQLVLDHVNGIRVEHGLRRVTGAGYDWSLVAENMAAGQAFPDAVVYAWMNSPPHMATILSPEAVHAGLGYVRGPDGGWSHYWTLVVAAPRHSGGGHPVPCHP